MSDEEHPPEDSGLSPLDLVKLPPAEYALVHLILVAGHACLDDLRQAMDRLPPAQHLDAAELNQMLATLCERGWLEQSEEHNQPCYKVVMSRSERKVSKIWDALE